MSYSHGEYISDAAYLLDLLSHSDVFIVTGLQGKVFLRVICVIIESRF